MKMNHNEPKNEEEAKQPPEVVVLVPASQLRGIHQQTAFHVVYNHHHTWHICGDTSLYVLVPQDANIRKDSTVVVTLGLHARSSLQIQTVQIGRMTPTSTTNNNNNNPSSFHMTYTPATFTHLDPFTTTTTTITTQPSQLRAASSLSHSMGELQISFPFNNTSSNTLALQEAWNEFLRETRGGTQVEGCMECLEIQIQYQMTLNNGESSPYQNHYGGIHCTTTTTNSTNTKDHTTTTTTASVLYTTAGVWGDHEGVRTWLPTLDASSHRMTHRITTCSLTAPTQFGMSILTCPSDDEDDKHPTTTTTMVHTDHLLHNHSPTTSSPQFPSHVLQFIHQHTTTTQQSPSHCIIVPSSFTTCIHSSVVLKYPIPSRSLGWAMGPFRIIQDHKIRQAYVAPPWLRPYLHTLNQNDDDTQHNHINNLLSHEQSQELHKLDQWIQMSTRGVVHCAYSLMRDVLALPTYRTHSYTQIWIPNHATTTNHRNPFLGGAILDASLLPPIHCRWPFYQGGKNLQNAQARNVFAGWIGAALPIGDEVGAGYLHALVEALIFSLYERGHGAFGEGGAKGSTFYTKRFAQTSGLRSPNLDFLPISNVEDTDPVMGGVTALPLDDRNTDYLWRSATNGTESHTAAIDEYNARRLFTRDVVEALERGTDKDKGVPMPSMGWFGSHLSLSFLSSNSSSSSDLGCGAVELVHPLGGLPYRALKASALREVVEGRAGLPNFLRLVRAAFIASHLADMGEREIKLPSKKGRKGDGSNHRARSNTEKPTENAKPVFHQVVERLIRKGGLTHNLFWRSLQQLCGRTHEANLLGTLVDLERGVEDPRTKKTLVEPEGFPNTYVRGAAPLYCRVGVHVEQAGEGTASQAQSAAMLVRGIQLQMYAEPVIPEGGIAYGGPITVRVVENEGYLREYVKDLSADGSRRDWGSTFLHAKPVSSLKAQMAASGTIEDSSKTKDESMFATHPSTFDDSAFHSGGFQAIELIRLTNLTPLLWVRVDPNGLYGGKIAVFQPDACLGEQLFHDGDALAQIESLRALAERPLRIQGSVNVKSIHDVSVAELPVRLLGDCLRGSPAVHSSLPHTPVIRCQAALAIAQWQNNKAPASKDARGAANWIGLNILLQYFKERFQSHSTILPPKYSRLVKKNEVESETGNTNEKNTGSTKLDIEETYTYLDTLEEGEERQSALEKGAKIESEEDEEYRVRIYVVRAIASIRAKDGLSPPASIEFLESVLETQDGEVVPQIISPEDDLLPSTSDAMEEESASGNEGSDNEDEDEDDEDDDEEGSALARSVAALSYVSSGLIAEALLSCCYINARPKVHTDPATGAKRYDSQHPLDKLIKIVQGWVEWEVYREKIRQEINDGLSSGFGGRYSKVSACALTALSHLIIARQSTIEENSTDSTKEDAGASENSGTGSRGPLPTHVGYYRNFFLDFSNNDLTRAAAAQAMLCIGCAADRFESKENPPLGLLTSLELVLEVIERSDTSINLRHILAALLMDACTGKICSMQRVAILCGDDEFEIAMQRFLCGPLGPGYGGDNGSAILTSVTAASFPAASSVNDGARRGLKLISRAGHPKEEGINEVTVVRVAKFATRLWRICNGGRSESSKSLGDGFCGGVCAYDGYLRCSLLNLYHWLWPRNCLAVMQVQSWKAHEGTERYKELGADFVMKTSDEEKAQAEADEKFLAPLTEMVDQEIDRQVWRGELYRKSYDISTSSSGKSSVSGALDTAGASEKGIGQPLPPIQRDAAFKQGGWVASAAQQRRAMALDGGTVVTKIRLTVKSSTD